MASKITSVSIKEHHLLGTYDIHIRRGDSFRIYGYRHWQRMETVLRAARKCGATFTDGYYGSSDWHCLAELPA